MSTYFAIRPDGSIAQSGSPDSLHAFAQREKYCIWTFNAQGGNLVCAYNPNSPSAPDYPNKASINTMRSGTKWAADSSSRRLRLHRALDCIMDRVGYGRAGDAEDGHLLGTGNGFEYWQLGDQVYRNQVGNRGPMTNGVPSNARWECSIAHYNRFKESVLGVK